VKKVLEISLGVLAAIGGFVDIGDLVFNSEAGATFGYQLIWAVVLGAIGIAVYAEMCGRVATVAKRPVFDVIRDRMGFGFGLGTLIASQFVNLLTLAAEVGGVALVLELLTGFLYHPLVLLALVILVLTVWVLPFEGIERIFGFGGLLLLTFTVAALKLGPNWNHFANGFVPHPQHTSEYLIWGYFAVGLIASTLMPYEVYFYSSGAVEEGWTPTGELGLNKVTAIVGFGLGAFLSISIMTLMAEYFLPLGIDPDSLGSVALAPQANLGVIGLLLVLLGMFFAVGGAAIDAAFSGAYNMAQFFGWDWGKYRKASGAPRFTLTWLILFGLAFLIIITGVNPIYVTEFAVVFSVVAMPLTYLPILLVARDRGYMGAYANGRLGNILGWAYFAVILAVAISAVPLLVLTNLGQG
jgi:manganese transport protein